MSESSVNVSMFNGPDGEQVKLVAAILVDPSTGQPYMAGSGGGVNPIDDTAGAGSMDKTWSADKLVKTFAIPVFNKITTKTVYDPTVPGLDFGMRRNYTIAPVGDSQAVSPAELSVFTVDTSQGNLVGEAHGIGHLDMYDVKGGGTCNLVFGKETRLRMLDGSHLEEFLLHKWVFEPNATNNGTIKTVTIDGLDDQTASAPYITEFRRQYADPRQVDYYNGGIMQMPLVIDSNVTLSNRHSGKIIYVNTANNVTITLGADVTDGFKAKVIQGTLGGKATFATANRQILSGTAKIQTTFAFDAFEVLAAGGGGFAMLSWIITAPSLISSKAANYNGAVADNSQYLRFTGAAAQTLLINPQTTVAWEDGTEFRIERAGTGTVTISPGAGVTINVVATKQRTISAQYGVATLKRISENVWTLFGDLTPSA